MGIHAAYRIKDDLPDHRSIVVENVLHGIMGPFLLHAFTVVHNKVQTGIAGADLTGQVDLRCDALPHDVRVSLQPDGKTLEILFPNMKHMSGTFPFRSEREAARTASDKEVLDKAVTDGTLTQAEADAVAKAVEEGIVRVRGGDHSR